MLDYMKVNGYSETFCQAFWNMVEAGMSKIKCDKTVKGVIIDDTKANFNYYTVSENNVNYIAYSQKGDSYKIGDLVYITIPNGDYNEQKFIMGRGYDDSSQDMDSNSFDLFVPFDIPVRVEQKYGLIANSDQKYIKIESPNDAWIEDLSLDNDDFIDFDFFIISANFATALPECRGGAFGLQVILQYLDKQNYEQEEKYLFLNSDMYGNVYQLKGATQKFLLAFDKEKIKQFINMEIYLYQQADFINQEKRLIPNTSIENIVINGLEVQYGYNKNNIEENAIMVQANTDKTYLDETDDLGKIKWRFLVKGAHGQNLRIISDQQLQNQEVGGLNQVILFYDKTFKAPENAILEIDSWRNIYNKGFTEIDFETTLAYNEALEKWNNYMTLLGDDSEESYYISSLELFTIESFRGFYSSKQTKSGIQIVLYTIDENNNIKILNKKSILFEKREEKE